MSSAPASRAPRILVVDDSESVRSYLASWLAQLGYRVDSAEDGRRALALLDQGLLPDLVLLDVMMPDMDGLETMREIRERAPRLPVVMVSVVGNARTIVDAMRAGATDYVSKPLDEAELGAVIVRALGRAIQEGAAGAARGSVSDALWRGPALAEVRALIDQVAETDVTVLIQGESGTGARCTRRRSVASGRS